MKKIIKSRIFYFILGAIIFSSVTVLASQVFARDIEYTKDGVTTNVESALNDLYDKAQNSSLPYVEGIYSNHSASINYTYTADEDGIFVAGLGAVGSGNITTTGSVLYEESRGNLKIIKIISLSSGDTINISASNNSYTAGVYLVKINNLSIDELYDSKVSYDTTTTSEYTATTNNEKVLAIAFSTGRDRSTSITTTGKFYSSYYKANDVFIGVYLLEQGSKVTATSYANIWSTTQTNIFKLK